MNTQKLSLAAAIIINLNIMLGSGIFINTVLLSQSAGGLGGLVYVFVAFLLLPLIYAIAALMHIRGGTFYDFGELIHPLIGFIMSWSYFTAKLASSALCIHVFASLMQTLFPHLASIPTLALDFCILSLFTFFNTQNMKFGSRVQYVFISLKLVPLLFIIVSSLFAFQSVYFIPENLYWSGLITSIPFVLFAFSGFEASCSLSSSLRNPATDGPKAILISSALVVAIVTLYQTSFFGILGPQLSTLSSFREAYPTVIRLLFEEKSLHYLLKAFTLIGIASSSLGAAYGILYSNAWNLHKLATQKHLFFSNFFASLNSNLVPVWCMITESIITAGYLLVTLGNQVALQQISATGSAIAYTSCAIICALVAKKYNYSIFISYLSVLSCLMLWYGIVRNACIFGLTAYGMFAAIVGAGIAMFFITYSKRTSNIL